MKVYVASHYASRLNEALEGVTALEAAGHEVTSRWIKMPPGEQGNREAQKDLDDVAASDVLLFLSIQPSGGKNVELGYALALAKRIVLVGERTNVFHYLDAVTVVGTLEEAIACLK